MARYSELKKECEEALLNDNLFIRNKKEYHVMRECPEDKLTELRTLQGVIHAMAYDASISRPSNGKIKLCIAATSQRTTWKHQEEKQCQRTQASRGATAP